MLRAISSAAVCAVVLVVGAGEVHADFITFTANPTSNSQDWTNFVTGLGGAINNNVDFNAHPTGALMTNFYSLSDGVTLTPSGDVNTVQFGAGPGQGNTTTPPTSLGEGLHPASNFLFDGEQPSSLTISFDAPVLGAGLFIIDYFNPGTSGNPLEIEAFTGANGTGTSLGIVSSVAFNFQPNHLYFMGVASSENDIQSIVFRDVNVNTFDTIGLDNIVFAQQTSVSSVPEPSSLGLLTIGACITIFSTTRRGRRKKHTAAA